MNVMNIGRKRNLRDQIMDMPKSIRIGRGRSRSSQIILPILIGLGIGALVGFGGALMVAPRSGRMTRMMLAERGNDLAYQARKITGRAVSRLPGSQSKPSRGIFGRNQAKTPAGLEREVSILESDIDKTYDL